MSFSIPRLLPMPVDSKSVTLSIELRGQAARIIPDEHLRWSGRTCKTQ
jgi:hypothetical protein